MCFAYNTTRHTITDISSYELYLGYANHEYLVTPLFLSYRPVTQAKSPLSAWLVVFSTTGPSTVHLPLPKVLMSFLAVRPKHSFRVRVVNPGHQSGLDREPPGH